MGGKGEVFLLEERKEGAAPSSHRTVKVKDSL
jgi:hypothetical protein